MNTFSRKHIIVGSLLLVALVGVPASLYLAQQNQENRSRATASTTLSYAPSTTTSSPLQKNVGETVSFDIMVDPGSNMPSLVKLEMEYDPNTFQVDPATAFSVNTTAFPKTIEGPVFIDGKVLISVSIGNDITKAIQSVTRVGTLTLTTTAPTAAEPASFTFGPRSEVLSVAPSDQSSENVLATTIPAYVSIASAPTPTQTAISPSASASPTLTLSLTPTSTASPTTVQTPTVTTPPLTTLLSFNVMIHGIGNSGDNVNPTASDLSNKNPLHPEREVMVWVYNDQNQLAASRSGVITYASASGSFIGSIDIGDSLPLGDYTVRIKEPTHLRRLVPGIHRITPSQENLLPQIAIVAGDANNDNTLNILDYNLVVGCYSDLAPAVDCDDERKLLTDINDDGNVNQFDYNIFLREITVQSGN